MLYCSSASIFCNSYPSSSFFSFSSLSSGAFFVFVQQFFVLALDPNLPSFSPPPHAPPPPPLRPPFPPPPSKQSQLIAVNSSPELAGDVRYKRCCRRIFQNV